MYIDMELNDEEALLYQTYADLSVYVHRQIWICLIYLHICVCI